MAMMRYKHETARIPGEINLSLHHVLDKVLRRRRPLELPERMGLAKSRYI
jgi:hypothetical protein